MTTKIGEKLQEIFKGTVETAPVGNIEPYLGQPSAR